MVERETSVPPDGRGKTWLMKTRMRFHPITRLALILACALPVAGCDALGDLILGENYDGPRPAAEGITSEVAVVRLVEVVPSGQTVLLIDRERYVEAGDPHNVNRVVRVASGEAMREAVAALNLARGDRVVVSTEYGSP
jgi:hypothetical protein